MAKRFLTWVLGSFVTMPFCCTFLPLKGMLVFGGIFLLAGIFTLFFRFPLKRTAVCCFFSAAAAAALFFSVSFQTNQIETALAGKTKTVWGEVTAMDQNAAGTLSCYQIRIQKIEGQRLPVYPQFCFYLYTEQQSTGRVGDYLSAEISFYESGSEYGTGRENGVYLSAYQKAADLCFTAPEGFSLTRLLAGFKETIHSRIIFGSEAVKGLLRSVCFGDSDTLDPALFVSLRRVGLSHVMAVSGLHLSFTVLLFNMIFLLLGIHYRARHLINIFISIFFTAAVGFPPSCIRACVMLILFSTGMALNLFSDGLTALSAAAFLLSLTNPLIIRDTGFLLSVLATLGILTLKAPIENFLFPPKLPVPHWVNTLFRTFTGIFSCSVAATLATLPVLLLVFGSVSPIAPLANVLLIYPLQFVFMLGILMVLLGWIPGFGAVIGATCDFLYKIIDCIAGALGHLQWASVSSLSVPGMLILFLLAGIIAVAVYDFIRFRQRSFLALFTLLLCFGGLFGSVYQQVHREEQENLVEIAFIDVGQGDCTVISGNGSAIILDYGGSSNKRYQLIDYLKKRNIHTVELLAFTHLHDDHTNGTRTLLKNVYVQKIIYPYLGAEHPELMTLIEAQNAEIILDAAPVSVLNNVVLEPIISSAYQPALADENERCICYRVRIGETSLLVTGDLEAAAELSILNEELDCTLLKVAHHGSDTSSAYTFLKSAAPEIAVISVGENTYGLPKDSVVSRLNTLCTELLITRENGTVVFRTDGKLLERIDP